MIKKLRIKFVVINMSIVTFMLCVIMGLVYFFTQENLEAQSLKMMKSIAVSPVKPDISVDEEGTIHLPYFAFKLGEQGEKITVRGGYYDLSDEELLDEIVGMTNDSSKRTGELEDYNLRYYIADTSSGRYLVFADMSSEIATLDHLMKTSFLIGGVAFFIFLLISIGLSKWVVRPVENAFRQQRQFIADASHELKTPLAVIMTNVQIMKDSTEDEESKGIFCERILTMSNQMKNLVEEMLELAHTENTEKGRTLEKVDLGRIVENAVLPFEPIFFENGLQLQTDIGKECYIKGDETQIAHLIEILLDNAGKYSKEDGRIQVNLSASGRHHYMLSVANDGDPIEKEKLDKLFDRFYRVDEARNSHGSYGLGLAIAKKIVENHGGKIWMESEDGINTCKVIFQKYTKSR